MQYLTDLIARYPTLAPGLPDLNAAFQTLCACFRQGGKLLICGNGGSAADSEHIVGELMKGFILKRPVPVELRARLAAAFPAEAGYLADHLQGALPAQTLTSQPALLTAFANDVAADLVFAQQVYGYGRPGDVLLGLSTSGNSANVIYALQLARVLGLRTVGLTGQGGGKMAPVCDVLVCAPAHRTPEIQEYHLAIYHALCAALEQEFFSV